jgi:hypothetical protein
LNVLTASASRIAIPHRAFLVHRKRPVGPRESYGSHGHEPHLRASPRRPLEPLMGCLEIISGSLLFVMRGREVRLGPGGVECARDALRPTSGAFRARVWQGDPPSITALADPASRAGPVCSPPWGCSPHTVGNRRSES